MAKPPVPASSGTPADCKSARQQVADLFGATLQYAGAAPGQMPRPPILPKLKICGDAKSPDVAGIRTKRTADGNDGDAQFAGGPGHPGRRFAKSGLTIQAAFAGDDAIAAGQLAFEADDLRDDMV